MKFSESNGLKPLVIDSFKSLPTAKEDQNYGDGNCSKATNSCVDLDLVTNAANWLGGVLDLTIFGFDVVMGNHAHATFSNSPFKGLVMTSEGPPLWNGVYPNFIPNEL